MKITCPTCNGEKFLHDLNRVQEDLNYPNGKLRQESQYPFGGFPALACKTCKGQGWVDSVAYLGLLFMLHLDPSGFWVLSDIPLPREAMFFTDPVSQFQYINTSLVNDGAWDARMASGFIGLN
jgi:hypothetical protein